MSIFGVNNDLMKQILREAEEDEFAIDDSEFNDPEDNSGDSGSDPIDDIMNTSDDSSEGDNLKDPVDDITSIDNPDNEEGNNDDTSESDDGSESADDSASEEQPSEGEEGTSEDDEFSVDGLDDSSDESEEGESGETDDGSNDEPSESSENVTDELVEKEKELFSNLTDEQMKIKTNELKKSFVTLSDTIEGTSERLSSITGEEEDRKIFKFLINKLDTLSDLVNDYMTNTFNSKTYIENTIYYQTCLAQLNTIKKVLEEMASKAEKETNQKDKS